jgi:hypothetical protein
MIAPLFLGKILFFIEKYRKKAILIICGKR